MIFENGKTGKREKIDIEIVGSDNWSFQCIFSIFLYIKCLKDWKESFALSWPWSTHAQILDMKTFGLSLCVCVYIYKIKKKIRDYLEFIILEIKAKK